VPQFSVGPDVFHREKLELSSVALDDASLAQADCVVIVTGHRHVDYARVTDQARLVVDCCNATAGVERGRDRIILLGATGW
jgi:UDP-N-acetyl-D-glucosamine dehydrogenase